jgi:hypothetical protein
MSSYDNSLVDSKDKPTMEQEIGIPNKLKGVIRDISTRSFILWLILSYTYPIFYLAFSSGSGLSSIAIIIYTINNVADSLLLGIPVFLGAGLFLTRRGFYTKDGASTISQSRFLPRYILYFMMVTLYLAILTLITFFRMSMFSDVELSSNIVYLPGILLSAPIMSFFLCPIGAIIAVLFDEWKLTTGIGMGLSFALTITTGSALVPSSYAEVALLGPIHLYRAIAIALSGIEFASSSLITHYFGVLIEPIALVVPVVLYVITSVLTLVGSIRLFRSNRQRWSFEEDPWLKGAKLETDPEDSQPETTRKAIMKLAELNEALRVRKKVTGILLVLLVAGIPLAGLGYTTVRGQEFYEVIYESPSGGETLAIGEWLFGSFFVQELEGDRYYRISWPADILDWGSCPDELRYEGDFREMSLDEFNNMNASERARLFGSSYSTFQKPATRVSSGYGGIFGEGERVWALRFTDSEGEIVPGTLRVHILVELTIN